MIVIPLFSIVGLVGGSIAMSFALVGKLPLTSAFPRAFIVEFPFGLATLAIVAGVDLVLHEDIGNNGQEPSRSLKW